LPVDSSIVTNGIITGEGKSFVLKSNTSPMKIQFGVINNKISEYSVLYKEGDDMRQDELAL